MKSFEKDFNIVVYGRPGLVPGSGCAERKILDFLDVMMKRNQSKIFRILRANYPNAKLARKRSGLPIMLENIPANYKASNKDYYKFENAMFALMVILLKGYDVNVSLTQTDVGDGGFDIVVSNKDSGEIYLLIDVKSGKNTSRNHVEWSSIQKNKDFYLLRVVKEADEGLGRESNKRGSKIHVLDMNLDHFIENLVDMLVEDSISLSGLSKNLKSIQDNLDQFEKEMKNIKIFA